MPFISAQVMTVHSLTQKMLAEFLETAPVQTDILLLSEHNIEDADMLRAALEVLQPEDLILECGSRKVSSTTFCFNCVK